jgi:hypothetical protein
LIGSTISTRSKKSVSCANKISSANVLSHDTKTSKVSEKANPHDFYPKNFNHAFSPKPDFDEYRNIAMVFDVKYDLRHEARLFAGGNWTVNDKEGIYSEVVCMDTVRIGFFLGELYGLSCCVCNIGNAFLYGKTKQNVYITAGPEFGANLHGKNRIIDKSLYGLKTSAARFYEHLSESFLR